MVLQTRIGGRIGVSNDAIRVDKAERFLCDDFRLEGNGQHVEGAAPALNPYLGPVASNVAGQDLDASSAVHWAVWCSNSFSGPKQQQPIHPKPLAVAMFSADVGIASSNPAQ